MWKGLRQPRELLRFQRIRPARAAAACFALAGRFLRRRQFHDLAQIGVIGRLVRNRHGLDEVVLKARFDRRFDFFDAPDQGLDDPACGGIEERDARAGTGGVAGRC